MGKDAKTKQKRGRAAKQRKKKSMAERADRYVLYQESVQDPPLEVEFLETAYRQIRQKEAQTLREDFCGTFAVSCEWAKKKGRRATAVDIDPEPLAWGREHNLALLSPRAQRRVTVRQRDVRTVADEPADILCAENFSYWIFRTRTELRRYFEIALRNLKPDGIMVLDLMGGGECYEEKRKDKRKLGKFTYQWECASFDPISHEVVQYINYVFKDGSKIKRAFEYHWRFWTIPEIRELLAEAGFAKSTVYWEGTDEETGEGNDTFVPQERGTCDPSWIAYIVAER